jgi:O-antigen/teichoic acid export membrane protein
MGADEQGEATTGRSRGGLALRALETFGYRVASLPLNFLVTLITSRYLLPEGRGAFTLGLLTVTICATILGNGTAVTYEVGKKRDDVHDVVVRGLALDVWLSVLAAIVLVPLLAVLPSEIGSAQWLILGLPLLLASQTVGGALLAVGRVRLFNVVLILDLAVMVVTMFFLVVIFDKGLGGAVAAWLAGQSASTLLLLVGARDTWSPIDRRVFQFRRMRGLLVLGLKAGAVSIISLLNYRVELFLLQTFDGLDAVGLYSVSVALAELLWLLSWAIQTVVVQPAVNETDDEAIKLIAQGVRHSLLLTGLGAIVLGAVSVFAIPIVFGEAFRGSIAPLLLLLPGVVVFSTRSPLSVYFSMRLGNMRYPLIVAGASAIATALLCIVLVPPFGPSGAAAATSIAYAGGSALLLGMFLKGGRTRAAAMLPRRDDLDAYRELARTLRARATSG